MVKHIYIIIASLGVNFCIGQTGNVIRISDKGDYIKKYEYEEKLGVFLIFSSGINEHTNEYFNISINSSNSYLLNTFDLRNKKINSVSAPFGLIDLHYNSIDSIVYGRLQEDIVSVNLNTGLISAKVNVEKEFGTPILGTSGISMKTNEYFNISIDSSNNYFLNTFNLNTQKINSAAVPVGLTDLHYNPKDSTVYARYQGDIVSINLKTGLIVKKVETSEVLGTIVLGTSGILENFDEYYNISFNSSNEYFFNKINILTGVIKRIPIIKGFIGLHYNRETQSIFAQYYGSLPDTTVTSLNEQLTNTNISIYPNPSTGSFNVQLQQPLQNASLQITNSMGLVVYSQSYSNLQNTTINTTGFATGLYNVSINNGNTSFSKKLVVY